MKELNEDLERKEKNRQIIIQIFIYKFLPQLPALFLFLLIR